jgi:hypothetical protein
MSEHQESIYPIDELIDIFVKKSEVASELSESNILTF